MRLLRTILAGLLVAVVGIFTAVVVGLSALVLWARRRWLGGVAQRAPSARKRRPMSTGGDVIDIEATEVERRPER